MSNAVVHSIRGYEITDLIGRGGFGEVYRATQIEVDREIALKIIRPEFANLPNFVRRFEAEARLIARLEHPHIVPLYDYWRTPDGAYFAMRYLRGGSLREHILQGQLTVRQIMDYFDQIASAVAFAHRHGVVHCDLKPSNVLFDSEQNVYLADFGIARAIHDNGDFRQVSGSPTYISPEQIARDPISTQSDIYSLGILLFELLTGQHPFADSTTLDDIFDKHLYETLPSVTTFVPTLPATVDDVLQTATAKNPALRYVDALQFAVTFRQVMKTVSPDMPIKTAAQDSRFVEVETVQLDEDSTLIFETVKVDIRNPYKGLRAFYEEDANDFFGRGGLIQRLANRLHIDTPFNNFLALVGPSGMGKSSVVRAGLIPALRRGEFIDGSDRWFITDMLPGSRPVDALHEALLRVAVGQPENLQQLLSMDTDGLTAAIQAILPPDSDFLLFIDQFEELFITGDETTIQHFLKMIHHAILNSNRRIKVILAIRADYYDRPLIYPDFSELLRARSEIIGPLTVDELEQAITEPLRGLGFALEKGLAASIITDVYEQPGSLPMLQYTLTELFDRREKNTLTIKAYRDVGGIYGALTRRSEEVFNGLSEAHQELANKLFLRLVSVREGTDDTRRRAHYAELVALSPDSMPYVIETFGDARLLTFDRDLTTRETTVEVAHEAIIRQWSRLRRWLDNFRDDFHQFRLLRTSLEGWRANDEDASYLLVGTRLDRFNEWRRNTTVVLSNEIQAYLDASNRYQATLNQEEERRRQQVRELRRAALSRLRQLVAVLVVGLLVVIGFLIVAVNESRTAELERDNAENARERENAARMTSDANAAIAQTQVFIADSRANETRALLLATAARNALLSDNPDLAISLAIEAVNIDPSSTEAYQILTDIAYQPNTRFRLEGHDSSVTAIAVSPDGKYMLSGAARPEDETADMPNVMVLWDLETGTELSTFEGLDAGGVNDIILNADASIAITAHDNGTITAWSLPNGVELNRLQTGADSVEALALMPDGVSFIASESRQRGREAVGYLTVRNIDTLQTVTQFPDLTNLTFGQVKVSPDGSIVVAATKGRTDDTAESDLHLALLVAWNAATGEELWRLEGGPQLMEYFPIVFNHAGTILLVAELEAFRVTIVDIRTTEIIRQIAVRRTGGHIARISSIDVSRDGQQLITASIDGSIVIWDLEAGEPITRLRGHRDQITVVKYLPDDMAAVSGAQDGVLRVWDLRFSAHIREFIGHTKPVTSIAFLPSGDMALSGSGDIEAAQAGDLAPSDGNRLILWDVNTGTILREFANQPFPIISIAVSADGHRALTGSFLALGRGHMVLWNIDTGEIIRSFDLDFIARVITAVGFNADATLAVSGTLDGKVQIWDLATGSMLHQMDQSSEPIISALFTPDDTRIITTSSSGSAIVWNATTGQLLRTIQAPGPMVRADISDDSRLLITPLANGDIVVWDIASGEEVRRLVGHEGGGVSAKFLPDERYAISAGGDQVLILWDLESGDVLQRYVGHIDTIFDVAISPDGRTALSGGEDRTIIQWRIETKPVEELVEWIMQNRYVPSLPPSVRAHYGLEN